MNGQFMRFTKWCALWTTSRSSLHKGEILWGRQADDDERFVPIMTAPALRLVAKGTCKTWGGFDWGFNQNDHFEFVADEDVPAEVWAVIAADVLLGETT